MSIVEAHGFGWRHAGRKAHAVRDVNLRISHGERVLLLGASGSGKSTLLAAMAGLLAEDSGEQTGDIRIDGAPARQRRDRVGMVFQDPQSQLVMARAGDDVAFGLENRAVAADDIWPRTDKALSTVGFRYGTNHPTNALSGGEQQRLALAGVLALNPSVLLLDEPTANLDPAGAAAVWEALAAALDNRDTTLVLVEHRLTQALPLVDRVVVLAAGGGIIADGSPSAVFAAHAAELASLGVWLPDADPVPPRRAFKAGTALLQATDLGFHHPGADCPALSHVDLTVNEGELTAVLGANGSGKSTLSLLLGGLTAPTTGSVRTLGPLKSGRPLHRRRALELSQAIGSVFQNPEHQFATSRVRDELALRPGKSGPPDARLHQRIDELLERLRLRHLADANPFTLSGGEARRLSVATALVSAPKVLIFDEPTFGQDRRTWIELVDLIAGLRDDGVCVVAVTHDPEFVDALADQTVTLINGLLT